MTNQPRRSPASTRNRSATPVDPARRAAYDVLHEVGAGAGYANLVARQVFDQYRLDTRDAAFATELVMGVLRLRGTLDAVLAACVDRPLAKLDPRLLDVLRLGAYQLLFLGTPTHAAVNTSVDLTAAVCGRGPTGLTNAVMRKVARRDRAQWLATITDGLADPIEVLAAAYSHPRWVIAALRDALAADPAVPRADVDAHLTALLAINNEPPGVTLVARPGRIEVAQLLSSAPHSTPGRWSPYAVGLTSGKPGDVAAVRSQQAGVQDEGSQLMAMACADTTVSGRDRYWLDMCAGPGGKAALVAAIGAQRGAQLVAVEPRAARARLVLRALAGSPGVHVTVQADGRAGPWSAATFDRILLDAPCTGLGVLRRRPESRWRRTPTDVSTLAALQRELLRSAITAARPGGVIAYVTCSPHIAETDLVVDDILAERADVEPVDARTALPDALTETLGPGPRVRLWPHLHGTDGMFLALLRRT